MKTSVMCAYCHSLGKRTVGQQTQTFYEWREDFWKRGRGSQNCQDCHMPRTVRSLAEDYDVPDRGGAKIEFQVINIGAGHSVPTGSNRRAVYLEVEVRDAQGKVVAGKEWMFAPWYGSRPDDKAFLEEDKKRPDAKAAMQADAQGPHEPNIRAGEERILTWSPELKPGSYTIQSRLVYDLNRYNDRAATEDQTVFGSTSLAVKVGK